MIEICREHAKNVKNCGEAGEYGATVRDEGCWEKQVGQAVVVRWAGSPC
jgi:hypothetical protein